jgi:diguanylate cyclase (GGDEF)-like protein
MRSFGLFLCVASLFAAPVLASPSKAQTRFEEAVADTRASMMSDPEAALVKAAKARAIAQHLPASEAVLADATIDWLAGEALNRLGRPADGLVLLMKAQSVVAKVQPETKLYADILRSRASVASKLGKAGEALPLLHQAYAIYSRLGESRSQAMILQNIGSLYYEARDYPRVLQYFDQAASAHKGDAALSVSLHNNRGNALKDMGRFREAEHEYRQALKLATEMDSPFLRVNILSNIASAQFLNVNKSAALKTVKAGLAEAHGAADEWRPFLLGTPAQIAFSEGDRQRATQLFEQTFSGIDLTQSTLAYRDYHETAFQLFRAEGKTALALAHLEAFKRLDDSAKDLAASTNNSLMSAQFDAVNQRARISKLESQKIQRNLELARSESRVQNFTWIIVLGGGSGLAVILALGYAFVLSRRRRREIAATNIQLIFTTRHDSLTGLANRSYYSDLMDDAFAGEQGSRIGLMLIDLDRFKWVNDTLGHSAGDELLCKVAGILRKAARSAAQPVRLGGDEFALIFPNSPTDGELLVAANTLIKQLSAPLIIAGNTVNIGATIGLAIAPDDGQDARTLITCADLALYHGKTRGRGQCVRFDPAMQVKMERQRSLEGELGQALKNGQLEIVYQAIHNATSEALIGYEALLRWNHPVYGAVPPDQFIPIAEEAGLIKEIGAWVLRTACQEAALWPDGQFLSVNLSTIQVEADGLLATVVNALAASNLPAGRLELEVTESVFLRQGGRAEETLRRLRELGVNLSLDDFGTGFSSLGYLQNTSFSTIKIDRSFVRTSDDSGQNAAIIKAIVSLARELGMNTTAEGIETVEELERVKALGCTQVQGYLFSRPGRSPSENEISNSPEVAKAA